MRQYELTVILRTGATLEETKGAFKNILSKREASIVKEEEWGVKKLAYEIDGEREGYYHFSELEADTQTIKKIEADFHLNHNILRYMFVVQTKKSAPKSA